MYDLVNDVPAYPEFLPWCVEAAILERRENCCKAYLRVGFRALRLRLVTENRLDPGRRIELRLLEGPFRSLQGEWCFEDLGGEACRVAFRLDFEFRGRVARRLLEPIFGRLVNSMLESFVSRARVLYG